MTAAPLVLLRRVPTDHRADGELLRWYAESGDEAAFAELVRRNGPLVLRACRNVLRDPAAADDAFQVTFLMLARNALRLANSPSVVGWLHTVAVRAAAKIRRAETRRQRRERPDREPPAGTPPGSPPEDAAWAEVRERIDAELARLPEEYRLALLLCYVEGLSYADAARRIGCTLGTLRGRLERGREALRRRLGRLGLPAVLVVAGAGAPAVGAGLRDATLAAVRSAAPTAARTALVWAKWTVALAAVATVGIGFAALRGPADPPKSESAPPPTAALTTAPTAAPAPAPEKTDAAGDPLPPGALVRMGSSRFHHGSNIHRLMVSADGKWVISYGGHTGYRVWDLATGKEQVPVGMPAEARFAVWHGQGPAVQWDAAIAPAGKRVVAVVPDRTQPVTRVLDVVTGEEVARVPASLRHVLTRPAETLDHEPELSPDGKWMMWTHSTRGKKAVYVADLTAKEPKPVVFTEVTDRNLFGFRFSDDARAVVMCFQDAYEVWDFGTRAQKLKVPVVPDGDWVGHAVISADGKTLAVVQPSATTFQLWDVAAQKELPAVADPFKNRVHVHTFSKDGRLIVASSGPLRVWEVATGKKVRDYGGPAHGAWAAAFTPDGKRIAVAQCDDVNVIDLETGESVHDFGGHTQSVGFVRFATDDRLVSFASSGVTWDPRSGKEFGAFPGHPKGTYGEAVSPNGKLIATCGADQKVRLRDAVALEEVRVMETKGVVGYNLAFTPDGKELAVGADKPGIRLFETATGRQLRVVAEKEVANWLRIAPDGRRVVFGRWADGTKVRVWDLAADKELLAFDAGKRTVNAPALAPDGRFLAAGDWDGFARVFELTTGNVVREFDTNPPGGRARAANIVYAVAFSPDGRLLATGNASGAVRVWELATGGERFRLDGHRGAVMSLAFSPAGTLLASGSSDRSAVTWDATGAALPTDPKHQPKDVADAWARLADRDATIGFAAVRYLAARPADAIPLFAKHLRPVAADPKAVAELIEKLGSEEFAEREAAQRELAALGEGAVGQLRAAVTRAESEEVRRRLVGLLAPFDGLTRAGDRLRLVRSVEVAERSGTAEARALLRAWAAGARGAELTEAARSALARLGGRE